MNQLISFENIDIAVLRGMARRTPWLAELCRLIEDEVDLLGMAVLDIMAVDFELTEEI